MVYFFIFKRVIPFEMESEHHWRVITVIVVSYNIRLLSLWCKWMVDVCCVQYMTFADCLPGAVVMPAGGLKGIVNISCYQLGLSRCSVPAERLPWTVSFKGDGASDVPFKCLPGWAKLCRVLGSPCKFTISDYLSARRWWLVQDNNLPGMKGVSGW